MNDSVDFEKDFGFARVYTIELKYRQQPKLDRGLLYEKMEQYTGTIEQPRATGEDTAGLAVGEANGTGQDNLIHFFHFNYMVQYAEGEMPAQTTLVEIDHRPAADYETAIQQCWHWQEAEQTLNECSYSLLLADMMASGLEPKSRLQLFTGALRAVLEAAPCDAIYFRESDKLVEPGPYLAAIEDGNLLYGAMNIRFYNVEGTGHGQEERLMDSIGLAALGIPDVQCHYYALTPSEVAGHLMDIAYYLFTHGDIIEDGETVDLSEDMRWRCEHQYALAGPHRAVIDLDPGEPYYAGRQGNDEEAASAE